jgi:hypothetical protein
MKKGIIIAVIAILVGGVVGYFLTSSDIMGGLSGGKPISVEYNFNAGLTGMKMIRTGDIKATTGAVTLTAAEVCESGAITADYPASSLATPTVTFPTAALLFSKCLLRNGDSMVIPFANLDGTTSTVFAAGAGGTANYESSLTVAAGKAASLYLVRLSSSAYRLMVLNYDN